MELTNLYDLDAEVVDQPEQAAALVAEFLAGFDKEVFVVITFTTKNQPIAITAVSVGSLSECLVDPKQVFREACIQNAAAIIVAHNHPSGDPTPSLEDYEVTERLKKCANLMDIDFMDHLVVATRNGFCWKSANISQ